MSSFRDNVVIVVAGASGDLAKKKTFPALFALFQHDMLHSNVQIVGYARTKMTEQEFRDRLSSYFKLPNEVAKKKAEEFKKVCTYISGQYDSDEGFVALDKHLNQLRPDANRLFYLALPPSVFGEVAARLKHNVYGPNSARIIIEKPFGHDLDSSRELQKQIGPVWTEDEVYRIDHYLGKEMVKTVLPLRFANPILGNAWNNKHISSVQLVFKEPFGTEGRGGYFDEIGIIRDVMQNHLLQVLSLLAMEQPTSFEPEAIRDAKVELLKALKPIDLKKVVLGQYDKSEDGQKPAYTDDKTVPEGSRCSTFAAFELDIDNDRWRGVPFIMSAGKALDEGKVEVVIRFKEQEQTANGLKAPGANELVIRVQPDEAVFFKTNIKSPGFARDNVPADLSLVYHEKFPDARIPEAYEALILDALNGDHANFVRDDELDVSWGIFTPLLHHIEKNKPKLEYYAYGSQGPKGVFELLKANL